MKKADFSYSALLKNNKAYVEKFRTNALMLLLENEAMHSPKKRIKLLSAIQVFSDYFQRTVLLRAALTENKSYYKIAAQHLAEEIGHNALLLSERKNKTSLWDPILESTACWFSWKMFTLDDIEATLLVHLVLEASANLFFVEANKVMQKYKDTTYFSLHSELDFTHQNMGLKFLRDLKKTEYKRLMDVQAQAWDVLNATCTRIAELVIK